MTGRETSTRCGDTVVLSGEAAAAIYRVLRLRDQRVRVRGLDQVADQALINITHQALAWEARTATVVTWNGPLTTAEVAHRHGVHPFSVRRACALGRLKARKDAAGNWQVDPTAAAAWRPRKVRRPQL